MYDTAVCLQTAQKRVLWHVSNELNTKKVVRMGNTSENSVFAGRVAKANGQLHKQKKKQVVAGDNFIALGHNR